MSAIQFIQRDPEFAAKPASLGGEAWTSGYWSISLETARKMVGGRIYFHKKQDLPAFLAGDIVGCEVVTEGKFTGRIIFRFRHDPQWRGFKTSREGWAMEKKIVWDDGPAASDE